MLSCKANPVLVQRLGFPHSGDPQLWDPCPQPCPTLASTGVTPASEAQGPLADCLSFAGSLTPQRLAQDLALRTCSGKVMKCVPGFLNPNPNYLGGWEINLTGLLALPEQEHPWLALFMTPTPSSKAQICLLSLKLTSPALCHLQPHSPSSWVMFLGHTKGLGSKYLSSIPGPAASSFLLVSWCDLWTWTRGFFQS